jgi:hypothetical protein
MDFKTHGLFWALLKLGIFPRPGFFRRPRNVSAAEFYFSAR